MSKIREDYEAMIKRGEKPFLYYGIDCDEYQIGKREEIAKGIEENE